MTVDYLSAVMFGFADTLDWNHLASTLCTNLEWHIVNVVGMWILLSVYVIHLAHGIMDSTRMESLRRSFRMLVKAKILLRVVCLYLKLNSC